MIEIDLSGKRAVVTGASKGIGAAAVQLLAEHGADVAFCARDQADIDALVAEHNGGDHNSDERSGAGSIRGYSADLADAESTDAFLESVMSDLGGADILVNNVGASPSRNFLYMSDEDWENLHQLNLMSAVRCTRKLLPGMRENKWGRVVMVSTSGAIYPGAALIDYAATKAAMIATGKALAGKYGADGVLVNSILPGLIRTDMWERAAGEIADAQGVDAEAIFERNSKGVPVGRYGSATEVANAIVFLCSDAASYINGVALSVDGGSGGHV